MKLESTKIIVSPWRSETPRALSSHLGAKLYKLDRLTGREKVPRVLINWGCSDLRGLFGQITINPPSSVRQAANKHACLGVLAANRIMSLDYTNSRDLALEWGRKGHSVIGHSDVHGHSGRGLARYEPTKIDEIPYCKLYTKYFPKDKEVRILVIRSGGAVAQTMYLEKKRILPERYAEFGLQGKPDWFIRTHDNGWIFAREAEEIPAAVELARNTCRIMGLTFAAVDILVKKNLAVQGGWECKVGEVNTAPGLTGQTLDFFKEHLGSMVKASLAF
jgi:hypothetical protein